MAVSNARSISLVCLLGMPAISQAAAFDLQASWWLTSLSGSHEHQLADWAAWHGRSMVLAWAVLLPLGALAARFFKILPGQDWPAQLDHRAWWHLHRGLQYTGVLVMTIGLCLAWGHGSGRDAAAQAHAWLGWSLCVAGWVQVAGGLLRGSKGGPTDARMRGDHYDMTRWRIGFERLHKSLGWLSILLAVAAVALGLVVADAPRWMAGALAGWWIAIGGAFAVLQRQGRCVDTYLAIWGPDAAHPGHAHPPVGWGVRRYTAAAWRSRFGPL